jgi:hypothetical protein
MVINLPNMYVFISGLHTTHNVPTNLDPSSGNEVAHLTQTKAKL